jgi:hypothetical protein
MKINHGLFDFRRFEGQVVARIKLNLFLNGVFIRAGCSTDFEILPKKRQHTQYSGGKHNDIYIIHEKEF